MPAAAGAPASASAASSCSLSARTSASTRAASSAAAAAGAAQTTEQADLSDPINDWLAAVLGDTETRLGGASSSAAAPSTPLPTLVRFSGVVNSGCGTADARTGPFYCPADQKLYIDPSFFEELKRMGAPGDFAAAYVIAHEVGHHVQNLDGMLEGQQSNARSVATELQADCYAGIWAHYAETDRDVLEDGEINEGLAAAAAVGDDRLQQSAGMEVQPESFTHGSSEQRQQWFRRGFRLGRHRPVRHLLSDVRRGSGSDCRHVHAPSASAAVTFRGPGDREPGLAEARVGDVPRAAGRRDG